VIGGRLSATEIDRWAERLNVARETARPIAPLTDEIHELGLDDAYAIAEGVVRRRVDAGARRVGHKIGLTSRAVQEQLGVDEPDYGSLLDTMQVADGASVSIASLIAPRVELEFAFHLGGCLAGPGVDAEQVRRATAAVQPAIELVDSRIVDWRIRLADTVADSASSAAFALGGRRVAVDEVDIADLDVRLLFGGRELERGNSGAVLGDPCIAVAWLANAVGRFGQALEPGDIVLSGACTRMAPVTAGDAIVGDFGPLGQIRLAFA